MSQRKGDRGKQRVRYLNSWCKWMGGRKVGWMVKREALLRTTRFGKLGRVRINYHLKG